MSDEYKNPLDPFNAAADRVVAATKEEVTETPEAQAEEVVEEVVEEIVKEELYELLNTKLAIQNIYSEYGMTELLSQAYGKNGLFPQSNSMRVLIRDINDPYALLAPGKTGGINIIDLANVHSCAFIETKDLGRLNSDGTFEVLGRFDNSDLRGRNLLVS